METCLYHQEIMRTLADCQVAVMKATERADDGKADITAIFSTLKELNGGQKLAASQLESIRSAQSVTMAKVDELTDKIDDHLKDYESLTSEFHDFTWFRKWMNNLRDHLPVWALTGLVGAILFILAITLLKDDVLILMGWKK